MLHVIIFGFTSFIYTLLVIEETLNVHDIQLDEVLIFYLL